MELLIHGLVYGRLFVDANWMVPPLKYLDSNERLTLDQAFHIFTVNPPKAVGMGQIMGKIKRGYLADFVVVNGDPSSMDPHNLKDTSVVYTFVDGKLSYGNIEIGLVLQK